MSLPLIHRLKYCKIIHSVFGKQKNSRTFAFAFEDRCIELGRKTLFSKGLIKL